MMILTVLSFAVSCLFAADLADALGEVEASQDTLSVLQIKASLLQAQMIGRKTINKVNTVQNDGNEVSIADKDRPRMLSMPGCAGSTFLVHLARKIVTKHGYDVAFEDKPMMIEMLKDKNIFFREQAEMMKHENNDLREQAITEGSDERESSDEQSKLLKRTIRRSILQARNDKKTLFFKGTESGIFDANVAKELIDAGTYVVRGDRKNKLDVASCYVRDCFTEGGMTQGLGKPIAKSGEESQLCMDRRKAPKNETDGIKVQFDIPKLVNFVEKDQAREQKNANNLVAAGYVKSLVSFSLDDLVGYEYSKDKAVIEKSLHSWGILLKAWGIAPNEKLILEVLEPDIGVREVESHQTSIMNFNEVKEAMETAGFGWMVRV